VGLPAYRQPTIDGVSEGQDSSHVKYLTLTSIYLAERKFILTEGEIVLVLDTQEVAARKGDFIVRRGTNHAWSNRSKRPAVLAIASHDGK